MKKLGDVPLKVRMMLLVSFIVISAVFVVSAALITQHKQQAQKEFSLRVKSVTEAAADSLELSVMIRQKEEIDRLLKGILQAPDLVSIAAYNAKRELLGSKSKGDVQPSMAKKFNVVISAEQVDIPEFPGLEYDGQLENNNKSRKNTQIIGSVEAVFSMERMEANLNKMFQFAFQLTLFVILVAVALGYFFADALTRPLARLVDATQKVAEGDLTHSVKNEAQDEIGHLSKSFNIMVDELANDIARRVKTEQALRKSEQRFQTLANKAPVGIFQFDVTGTCIFANPKCSDIIGVSEQAILITDWIEWVCLEDRERVRSEWDNTVLNSSSFYSEFRFLHPHEQHTWVIGEIYPERDGEGGVRGFIGTVTDVTALKIITEELRRSNDELDSFARIASHDLKEPMRKIQSFGSILEEDFSDVLGEKGGNYLDRVINAAERMQSLIEGLLVYSRVTTKAQPFQEVDINTLTNDVLNDLEIRIEETGGTVEMEVFPTVMADPLQMRQLMQNLISNSLKYHRDNVPPVVSITNRLLNEMVEVTIADNGIGFDQNHAERIFGVFERLHGRSEQYEGTGVGLSICKKIVERHGGVIQAHGECDKGSTFVFTLPLSTAL